MQEIFKLRLQLSAIAALLNPRLKLAVDVPPLPALSRVEERLLSQVVLAGFLDQIAMRRPGAPGTPPALPALPSRVHRALTRAAYLLDQLHPAGPVRTRRRARATRTSSSTRRRRCFGKRRRLSSFSRLSRRSGRT